MTQKREEEMGEEGIEKGREKGQEGLKEGGKEVVLEREREGGGREDGIGRGRVK